MPKHCRCRDLGRIDNAIHMLVDPVTAPAIIARHQSARAGSMAIRAEEQPTSSDPRITLIGTQCFDKASTAGGKKKFVIVNVCDPLRFISMLVETMLIYICLLSRSRPAVQGNPSFGQERSDDGLEVIA